MDLRWTKRSRWVSSAFVDHTHTATTEFLKNAVVRDRLSDERLGFRHVALILGCDCGQVNEDKLLGGPSSFY
jgi:hypothetical protein